MFFEDAPDNCHDVIVAMNANVEPNVFLRQLSDFSDDVPQDEEGDTERVKMLLKIWETIHFQLTVGKDQVSTDHCACPEYESIHPKCIPYTFQRFLVVGGEIVLLQAMNSEHDELVEWGLRLAALIASHKNLCDHSDVLHCKGTRQDNNTVINDIDTMMSLFSDDLPDMEIPLVEDPTQINSKLSLQITLSSNFWIVKQRLRPGITATNITPTKGRMEA